MNKTELIRAVAAKAEVTVAEATKTVNATLDVITEALAAGNEVVLTGFGTYKVAERPARTGRNPQTGETVQIAASKAPVFKAGKALKDSVK